MQQKQLNIETISEQRRGGLHEIEIIYDRKTLLTFCILILKQQPDKRSPSEVKLLLQMAENIQFFNNLVKQYENDESIIVKCVNVLKHQSVKQNEILFRAGDIGTLFYIILEGTVGINIKLPNPQDPSKFELKEVNSLHAGASFGELALLNDNVQRTATIISKTNCEFAIMEKKDYKNILGRMENQKIANKISFLTSFPFFQAWGFREMKTISYHFQEQRCFHNEIIFKQGDKSDYFYVVKEGAFEITFTTDLTFINANNYLQYPKPIKQIDRISLLESGEFFGEESFHVKTIGFRIKLKQQPAFHKFQKKQSKKDQSQNQIKNKEKKNQQEQEQDDLPIEEQIQSEEKQQAPQEWSQRFYTIRCVSQNGLLYRISREDIQKRFWDTKTITIFLKILELISEYRQKRKSFLEGQIIEKKEEQKQNKTLDEIFLQNSENQTQIQEQKNQNLIKQPSKSILYFEINTLSYCDFISLKIIERRSIKINGSSEIQNEQWNTLQNRRKR